MRNQNDDDHLFDQFLKDKTNIEIPPELDSRLNKRISDFRKKIETINLGKRDFSISNFIGKTLRIKPALLFGAVTAILIILLGIYIKPWNKGPEKVYAAVVNKFEKAKTMTYKCLLQRKDERKPQGMSVMRYEFFYKAPGHVRIKGTSGRTIGIVINNLIERKGIFLMTWKKQYNEIDYTNMSEESLNRQIQVVEHMRSLPKRADKVLGEREIDNRKLLGFIVYEEAMKKIVWFDTVTEELVRIDMEFVNMTGANYTISDIKFDVALNDSLFSLTPPEGYKMLKRRIEDSIEPTENDLINFLRIWTSLNQEKLFPPTLNDISELIKAEEKLDSNLDRALKKDENMKRSCFRGFTFVLEMKRENEWHYKGKDVKLGSSDVPICWWKPDGSQTYRIIYGDLQIRNITSKELEKFEFNP